VSRNWSSAEIVRRGATRGGERPALSAGGVTWSWSELYDSSKRAANGLASLGVSAGDRVAILDRNGPAHVQLILGAGLIRAVPVPVNWRLSPSEVSRILKDAQARALIIGPDFIEDMRSELGLLGLDGRVFAARDGAPGTRNWVRWLAEQSDMDPGAEPSLHDAQLQLYTSGTTGRPKGVVLSNANIFASSQQLIAVNEIDGSSVALVAGQLFHLASANLQATLSAGGHIVLPASTDPLDILDTIETYQITHASFVPAMLKMLMDTPGVETRDFSTLRYVIYGGSPISERLMMRCVKVMGVRITQGFGMTETAGAVTLLSHEDHLASSRHPHRLRSCGKALPGVELRVVDPVTGEDQPTGGTGEILVRSAQNTIGYWRQPEATAETIDDEGWLHTGDAGSLDDDGYLYLHDRLKDMIVSGAENVYPAEIENLISSHPAVFDVAVIGVPHPKWGETVKAVVVVAPDETLGEAELIDYCRSRVAHYKCPTSVEFVDELPRNAAGKLLKRQLREPYWANLDRRVN